MTRSSVGSALTRFAALSTLSRGAGEGLVGEGNLRMKAPAVDYVRPRSLAEAVDLLAKHRGEARVIAGGQSLLAMMNLRVASPGLLIDISRLAELSAVSDDADAVTFGACVTHAEIEDGRVADPSGGLMPRVAASLGYRAIRNRGTIGGSLALSDPAAEWPAVLTALDAEIMICGPSGRRSVKSAEFTTGIFETVLAADEIIESVRIPRLSADARWGYLKLCRKSGEFASALAVAIADHTRGHCSSCSARPMAPRWPLNETSRLVSEGARRDAQCCCGRSRSRGGPAFRRVPAQPPHRRCNARSATGAAVTAIRLRINGAAVEDDVPPRLSLADFLRERRNLTGTHLGCEHGVCGACTMLVDGEPARSCLMLAVACDEREITTIEGFADDTVMQALRRNFHQHHALQCGYCTPAMLITARDLILRQRAGSEREIRDGLAGNICRCTGYTNIVTAIAEAAKEFGRETANA